MKVIEVTEYESVLIPRHDIPQYAIQKLRTIYKNQLKVTLRDAQNGDLGDVWEFKALGWVGYIPLSPELGIRLLPKVPVRNLFAMLEYAYNLKSFRFLEGLANCATLEDFCGRLGAVLAERILDISKRGIYRNYVSRMEKTPYIRGRLELRQTIQQDWHNQLTCHYQEYTADIEDNQILVWTLYCLSLAGIGDNISRTIILQAYRFLKGPVTLRPFRGLDCINRTYNHLNKNYEVLHIICYFFLEHINPAYQSGEFNTLPFLVDMPRLYELFVGQWLHVYLPPHYTIKAQERVNIGKKYRFQIDLVVSDLKTGMARYVMDTKYKVAAEPAREDISQIVAYATAKNCEEAVLIYPTDLPHTVDGMVGDSQVRLRSLSFRLSDNLEAEGRKFLQNLLNY